MPTDGHDSSQNWMRINVSGWVRQKLTTRKEHDSIDMMFGRTVDLPLSPYPKSKKQPEILLRPMENQLLSTTTPEVG
jgi:hypothetical protein